MLVIDGRTGEGGGQVLRTSLALSMITGIPVTLEHIRAKRTKPGLMRQHLTCVRAAKEVCGARVTGDEIRSSRLVFEPGEVAPGEYDFAIGTAGSTSLVLQTVLPALMLASEPSVVRVSGGTHNQKAPPVDYIERVFAPLLERIGPQVEVEMVRAGFYPAGGGLLQATISPCARDALGGLELLERGADLGRRVRSVVSNLPKHICARENRVIAEMMGWDEEVFEVESWESPGPGNVIMIEVMFENVRELFTAVGEKGRPGEKVAKAVVEEARAYLAAGAPVGEHLADQLMIPMALAGRGVFRCTPPSMHTRTQVEVIEKFLEVEFVVEREEEERSWVLRVES